MRAAADFSSYVESGTLLSKMDSTQHNRGWDLALEHGILYVDLVNEGPKDLVAHKSADEKEPEPKKAKEVFQFPTPTDLTAKALAPNKTKAQKALENKPEEKKPAKKEDKPAEPKPALDTT